MDVDDLLGFIEESAEEYIYSEKEAHKFVEELLEKSPKNLLDLAKEIMSEDDKKKSSGYLPIGYFTEHEEENRLAIFFLQFEITNLGSRKKTERMFRQYSQDDPIFSRDKILFDCLRTKENGNKDYELINSKELVNLGGEIFQRNNFFYKLEHYLPSAIYSWGKTNFPNSEMYIRLNPLFVETTRPLPRQEEQILMPANPNWWENLEIHKNSKEGSSYFLDDVPCSQENYNEHWDYTVRKIRRLDVIAKRANSGNLSMMLEEISEKESDCGMTIGRCIHLDTDSQFGTDFHQATLNHIDLAINVYCGNDREKRYRDNLASGNKVQDATFRTHIFRIENIPLGNLINFAEMFFKSKILVNDWLKDQFGVSRKEELLKP